MIQRCHNPNSGNYRFYGGRGITVCLEWRVFKNFQVWCEKTFEPGKSLDRRDNSKGYSPGNCQWATKSEQVINSRKDTDAVRTRHKNLGLAGRKALLKKYGAVGTREEKWCAKCGTKHTLNLFGKNKASADGLTAWCLAQLRERQRASRSQ